MPRPDRIEGLAIVSVEGMIADADGIQPPSLKPTPTEALPASPYSQRKITSKAAMNT
mgnify:CR=1 FL=1